ncbi:DUF4007 family protein [Kyrpidia sp.]|uniref:DUF4007 family protein n=1 Tax=Kyrpidia sp. TaxID=2073077 RepID=UPI0025863892|nr:DUF4007 family protein [Kyrpidia sp.]
MMQLNIIPKHQGALLFQSLSVCTKETEMGVDLGQFMILSEHNRFGFGGHETFPFRYGWLKKAVDGIQVLGDDRAIVELGVGKNMVRSIRHWGLATQMLRVRNGRQLEVSEIGRLLMQKWDPYLEDPASMWLIHWLLIYNPARAAVWHLVFTSYTKPEFTKGLLVEFLSDYAARHGLKVKESTVSRDVDCFIRSYVASRSDRELLEDSFGCPLAELALIQPLRDGEGFRFAIGPKPTLPLEIFGYSLFDYLERVAPTRQTLSLSECLYGQGSPGQVFKLDENSLIEYLEALQEYTEGAALLDETAGLKQLYCRRKVAPLSFLDAYYAGWRT